MPYWPEEQLLQFEADEWSPPQAEIDRQLAINRGSWRDQMPHRAENAFYMQTFVFLILLGWRAGGLMLIGMALYRLGVLTGKRSNTFYLSLIAVGGIVGIPLILYGVHRNFAEDWSVTYSFFAGRQYNYWGSMPVSMAYLGAVMLVCKTGRLGWLTRPLAKVGQMALTNYLLQTIICTTIFYGHGFGQFGHFSRVQQIITVVAVWMIQIIISPIWLRHFQFGPVEWLWRSLSYWSRQPMRRTPS